MTEVKKTILEEAQEIVSGDRNKEYGEPEDCFQIIANLWNGLLANQLKVDLTARDVAIMLALMKVARLEPAMRHNLPFKRDTLVDIAGYTLCADKINNKDFPIQKK